MRRDRVMNKFIWVLKHPVDFITIKSFCKRVKDYNPQKVNPALIFKWLDQFSESDRGAIISLLPYIQYYSMQKIMNILVEKNRELLERLKRAGIERDEIIYVTVDETASSSHLMLNMLRDAAQLQRAGVHFIDSRSGLLLVETMTRLGRGAIIYVDDFAGTGSQFLKSRNDVADQMPLVGQFSEFFLLPCICREAFDSIQKEGVEVICDYIHEIKDRPLHPDNNLLNVALKQRLMGYCQQGDSKAPLGYGDLASMVAIYRNTPNSMPILFRGNVGQNKLIGILPRITDLSARI
jgi:hypothetical protein